MTRTIDMARHPRLVRRGTRYYYRRRVPADLVSEFSPCIRVSLGTSDPTLAVALCRRYDTDYDVRFAKARAVTKPFPVRQPLSLSQLEIDAICDRYLADSLFTDDESRALGHIQPLFDVFKEGDELVGQSLSKMLARGELTGLAEACFDTGLRAYSLDLSRLDAKDFLRLRYAFLRTLVKYFSVRSQRNNGHVVLTKDVVATAPNLMAPLDLGGPTSNGVTLRDLHDYWSKSKSRPAKTVEDYGRIVDKFVDYTKESRADVIVGKPAARTTRNTSRNTSS